MIRSRSDAILVGLLVVAVALVTAELVAGATHSSVKVANPCEPRALFPGHGVDATIQRVVLDGLDRTACKLRTSREELVLSLDGKGRWDRGTIDKALRTGLLRAVDAAERRGDIPRLLAPLVRGVVKRAPLTKLLNGTIGLRDLFG
jgi:hypothetical protein